MNARIAFLLAFTLAAVAIAFFAPPMPQPLSYHDFADKRVALGIPNFLDVGSNIAFAVAGAVGLAATLRPRSCFERAAERWPYALFFVGLLLTAAGSAYYHVAPDNETLLWDRLPMTIGFMSLFAAQIVDRIDVRLGLRLLVPLLLVGFASVAYWIATERAGHGNVIPYGVLQAYSVVVLLILAFLQPSRYTRAGAIYWVFAAYVLAKVLEHFDRELLDLGHLLSGHTLKHVAAAVSGLIVAHMLWYRRLATRAPTSG